MTTVNLEVMKFQSIPLSQTMKTRKYWPYPRYQCSVLLGCNLDVTVLTLKLYVDLHLEYFRKFSTEMSLEYFIFKEKHFKLRTDSSLLFVGVTFSFGIPSKRCMKFLDAALMCTSKYLIKLENSDNQHRCILKVFTSALKECSDFQECMNIKK